MNSEDIKVLENKDFSSTDDFQMLLDIVRDCLLDIRGAANEKELHIAIGLLEIWASVLERSTPVRNLRKFKGRKENLLARCEIYLYC